MKTFKTPFTDKPEIRALGQAIEAAAGRADPFFEMQVLHAEPARVRSGMVIYADGGDWDPGSGEGIYRRDAANAAWVFLG